MGGEYQRAGKSSNRDVESIEEYMRDILGSADDTEASLSPQARLAQWYRQLVAGAKLRTEILLYKYYNWRKDTSSDLILILVINGALIMAGTAVKYLVVDPHLSGTSDDAGALAAEASREAGTESLNWLERIWPDVYQVVLLTFGENFPDVSDTWQFQLYSVAMGLFGVIGFALLLALTEQFLLEVLESNVRQGTRVFERGHVLVLAQCIAGKDMETLWRIINQIVWAYASTGGKTVVVMTSREKVSMESVFRGAIPDTKGSQLIFRKGSLLLTRDLRDVNCALASSIIIVSDQSRRSDEADAQTTRSVVLIDELIQKHEAHLLRSGSQRGYAPPHIVTELLQAANCRALQFATALDVHMVLTRNLNAKRLARMVLNPVMAGVSAVLFDYRTDSQSYTQGFPQLAGKRYQDVPFSFDMATVLGLYPADGDGSLVLSPDPNYVLQEDDLILLLRSSKLKPSQIVPRLDRLAPSQGSWRPRDQSEERHVSASSYAMDSDSEIGGSGSMTEGGTQQKHHTILIEKTRSTASAAPANGDSGHRAANASLASGSTDGAGANMRIASTPPRTPRGKASRWGEHEGSAGAGDSEESGHEFYELPSVFVSNADRNEPVKVLIVGWGQQGFMEALLHELDRGDQSLPVGSEVVFMNLAEAAVSVGAAVERVSINCLHISHIQGNPLAAESFETLVDMSEYSCAMCLCDSLWVDPDADSMNGVDFLEENDMLRLDSMLLLVQLHIRYALKAQKLPDINIICEKLAIAGVTRFEDRFRLPLGISVNMTSYAAKLLVLTSYDPEYGIRLVASFGKLVDLTVVDSSALCGEGEAASWYDLVARAQMCRLVLFAHYEIPASLDIPLKLQSNPTADRFAPKVWNDGSSRYKFICFEAKAEAAAESAAAVAAVPASASEDTSAELPPALQSGNWSEWSDDDSLDAAITAARVTTGDPPVIAESLASGPGAPPTATPHQFATSTRARPVRGVPRLVAAPPPLTARDLHNPETPLSILGVLERKEEHAPGPITPAQAVVEALITSSSSVEDRALRAGSSGRSGERLREWTVDCDDDSGRRTPQTLVPGDLPAATQDVLGEIMGAPLSAIALDDERSGMSSDDGAPGQNGARAHDAGGNGADGAAGQREWGIVGELDQAADRSGAALRRSAADMQHMACHNGATPHPSGQDAGNGAAQRPAPAQPQGLQAVDTVEFDVNAESGSGADGGSGLEAVPRTQSSDTVDRRPRVQRGASAASRALQRAKDEFRAQNGTTPPPPPPPPAPADVRRADEERADEVSSRMTVIADASGGSAGAAHEATESSSPYPSVVQQRRAGGAAPSTDVEVDGEVVEEISLPSGLESQSQLQPPRRRQGTEGGTM